MKRAIHFSLVFCLTIVFGSQASGQSLPDIDISGSPDGVVSLPDDVPSVIKAVFVKYTKVVAPNGKPIHLLAQDSWTVDQIKHARNVLEHILRDFPGSVHGNDKSAIANTMADRKATMVLFNDTSTMRKAFESGLRSVDLSMQDLRSNESPAVGDKDYMDHITRDASYEEIWHLVHDYGVVPTLPEMVAEMRKANDVAEESGWRGWPEDEPEGHPNEYVGVLIDNYYDLWMTQPQLYEAREYRPGPEGTTHFGRYFANGRSNLKEKDPLGFALIENFFPPYLTYTPQLPQDFSGTFSMTFNDSQGYTHKSQQLVNVELTGENDAAIVGNAHDNILSGNAGANRFTGGAGNDQIDGRGGDDTAVFSGSLADYEISEAGGALTVSDKQSDRDGTDTLTNVELFRFGDQEATLEQLRQMAE